MREKYNKMLDYEIIKKMPKIELHCHLDGSLRYNSVIEEAKKQNIDLKLTENEIKEKLIAPKECESLDRYLESFELPLKVMQTSDSLKRFTYEVFEDSYKEGIVYMELRFAPVLHMDNGMTMKEIIRAVIEGMKNAEKKYGIYGNIILCCMKNYDEKYAIETIEAGKDYLGKGVVGIDLAGPELEGFSKKFKNSMRLAKNYGYYITIHAGEAASGNNVYESIKLLGAQRIGHGVRTFESSKAYNAIKNKEVFLEVCPSSNIQTKAVKNLKTHPFIDYYKDDIHMSFNTDNRTVSDTTLSKEIFLAGSIIGLSLDDYNKMYYNTVGASFALESTKNKLLNKMELFYKNLKGGIFYE